MADVNMLDRPLDDMVKEARQEMRKKKRKPLVGKKGVTAALAAKAAQKTKQKKPAGKQQQTPAKGTAAPAKAATPAKPAAPKIVGRTLFISGLKQTVNDQDLREMFQPFHIVSAHIHYGPDRRHLGTATVQLRTPKDAQDGMAHYDGCKLDGAPLRISIIPESTGTQTPAGKGSIESRLGPRPGASATKPAAGAARGNVKRRGGGRGRRGRA